MRFGTLAVANLRFYSMIYTNATVDILVLSAFCKSTAAQYAQWEHRTSNLTITILCCNRLSYAAASMTIEEGV